MLLAIISASTEKYFKEESQSFFNGMLLAINLFNPKKVEPSSHNPYFNGMLLAMQTDMTRVIAHLSVTILILMECSLQYQA